MSEKRFSTDEIVATVMKWRGWDMDAVDEPAYKEIIARLHAADVLCEAAIGLLDFIRGRFPKDFESGGAGFTCPYHEAIRKAIADYEKGDMT